MMKPRTCKDCVYNYDCPLAQEGFIYNPEICSYNPDNVNK